MVKIDLITGFLGSGKTTFLKKYAKYYIDQGQNIGILENDFGAVNVDMMLLQDIAGENCSLEMVAGGCDADCHKRRFKTKLIAMGMSGYDRVIIEPSGIFDMDEFFDVLHEDPINKWFEIGSVIAIVDADLESALSKEARFLLASQIAQAGILVYSHVQETSNIDLAETDQFVNQALQELNNNLTVPNLIIKKDWDTFIDTDYDTIKNAGYRKASYEKLWLEESSQFETIYFMNKTFSKNELEQYCSAILADETCGTVFRIKGFQQLEDQTWIELNANQKGIRIQQIPQGQNILIVIGEQLNKQKLESFFGESC